MATPLPINQAPFSLTDILACTGGRVCGPLADAALHIDGVATDTRTLLQGQAFVALRGDRFDGHEHVSEAARRGATLAIVEHAVDAPAGLTLLVVESTRRALGALAHEHLTRWRRTGGCQVVGLTGSAGKTTTKWAIATLLEAVRPGQVFATPGNLNNDIGVPHCVLCLDATHRFAVLEVGTNAPGEIANLSRMIEPDLGLLTLVAAAHTEGLGGIDAVAREKGSLFEHLVPHEPTVAVGNGDDPRVRSIVMASKASKRLLYGQSSEDDYRITDRRLASHCTTTLSIARPEGAPLELTLPLIGRAGALAVVAAVAVVETIVGELCDRGTVERAFANETLEGRLMPARLPNGVVVIDDSYNANPASCAASIEAASEVAAFTEGRLVLVLGEMRELGNESIEAHEQLGRQALEAKAQLVFTIGGDAKLTHEVVRQSGVESTFFDDSVLAAPAIASSLGQGDVVLVKGSRGVRTERVVKAIGCTTEDHVSQGHGTANRAGVAS